MQRGRGGIRAGPALREDPPRPAPALIELPASKAKEWRVPLRTERRGRGVPRFGLGAVKNFSTRQKTERGQEGGGETASPAPQGPRGELRRVWGGSSSR